MRPHFFVLAAIISCADSVHTRPGNVSAVFCDVKRALNDSLVTLDALATLLPALVDGMHCNGLRVPLMPGLPGTYAYPATFNYTLAWARSRALAIYASPMERSWAAPAAGGGNRAAYARWLAAYVAAFAPTYLSPFNEVGSACETACMSAVVTALRAAVPHPPLLVGPDAEHVKSSLADIRASADALSCFDIVSSHNAGGDTSNSPETWKQLVVVAAGRPVWSSENPTCFALKACILYGTMQASVSGGVSAIVTWNTLGDDILLTDGNMTDKGRDIASRIGGFAAA